MAYICGIVTTEEMKVLHQRGWDIEDCPKELIPDGGNAADNYIMVWVDASVFDVMNGPDWEKKEDNAVDNL
jgi:hypothetical protein